MTPTLLPTARKFNMLSDEVAFCLNGAVGINGGSFALAADAFRRFLFDDLKLLGEAPSSGSISFQKIDWLENEEYKLSIDIDSIVIEASSDCGAFYAVESLKQLLISSSMKLPRMEILDKPNEKVRSLIVDTEYGLFKFNELKDIIDLMCMLKLNRLILRINSDNSWRLELYGKLLLAQIGGFVGKRSLKRNYDGFLSQEELEKLIKYAKERFVEIVPEIRCPSNMVSAVVAYPELQCSAGNGEFCIGSEKNLQFMTDVWAETLELFGSGIAIIGGIDEHSAKRKNCQICCQAAKINGTYTEKLSEWFNSELTKRLEATGAKVEISTEPEFDLSLSNKKLDLKDILGYQAQKELNVGISIGKTKSHRQLQALILPRLAAYAQRKWSASDDNEEFFNALDGYCFMLDAYGFNHGKA